MMQTSRERFLHSLQDVLTEIPIVGCRPRWFDPSVDEVMPTETSLRPLMQHFLALPDSDRALLADVWGKLHRMFASVTYCTVAGSELYSEVRKLLNLQAEDSDCEWDDGPSHPLFPSLFLGPHLYTADSDMAEMVCLAFPRGGFDQVATCDADEIRRDVAPLFIGSLDENEPDWAADTVRVDLSNTVINDARCSVFIGLCDPYGEKGPPIKRLLNGCFVGSSVSQPTFSSSPPPPQTSWRGFVAVVGVAILLLGGARLLPNATARSPQALFPSDANVLMIHDKNGTTSLSIDFGESTREDIRPYEVNIDELRDGLLFEVSTPGGDQLLLLIKEKRNNDQSPSMSGRLHRMRKSTGPFRADDLAKLQSTHPVDIAPGTRDGLPLSLVPEDTRRRFILPVLPKRASMPGEASEGKKAY